MEKPADDEVTPAMIEAGLDALTSRYQDLVWPVVDAYPEIVATVYQAMQRAARQASA